MRRRVRGRTLVKEAFFPDSRDFIGLPGRHRRTDARIGRKFEFSKNPALRGSSPRSPGKVFRTRPGTVSLPIRRKKSSQIFSCRSASWSDCSIRSGIELRFSRAAFCLPALSKDRSEVREPWTMPAVICDAARCAQNEDAEKRCATARDRSSQSFQNRAVLAAGRGNRPDTSSSV